MLAVLAGLFYFILTFVPCIFHYMYNELTNAHLTDSLSYCSLLIAPTCFNTNASSSGSSHLVPAKLCKCVHV